MMVMDGTACCGLSPTNTLMPKMIPVLTQNQSMLGRKSHMALDSGWSCPNLGSPSLALRIEPLGAPPVPLRIGQTVSVAMTPEVEHSEAPSQKDVVQP
jgi:hypothetical protein